MTTKSITQERFDKLSDGIYERLKADPSKIAPFVRSYCDPSLSRSDRAKIVREAKADKLALAYLVQEYLDYKYVVHKIS